MMAKKAVRPKKLTVGSSLALRAAVPEILSVVEALPLQIMMPEKVGQAGEVVQEPRVATPKVTVLHLSTSSTPKVHDEYKFQAMMASLSQRGQLEHTAPEPACVKSPVEEISPPPKHPPKRTRREEVRTVVAYAFIIETGGESVQGATTKDIKVAPRQ